MISRRVAKRKKKKATQEARPQKLDHQGTHRSYTEGITAPQRRNGAGPLTQQEPRSQFWPAPVAPAPTAGSPRRSPPRGPGRDPLHYPGRPYRRLAEVGQARACAARTAAKSAITGSRWRARAATEAILGGPGRRVPVPVALPRPGHVHDAPRGFSEQRPQGSHAHKAAPRPRRPLPVRVPLPAPPPASLPPFLGTQPALSNKGRARGTHRNMSTH